MAKDQEEGKEESKKKSAKAPKDAPSKSKAVKVEGAEKPAKKAASKPAGARAKLAPRTYFAKPLEVPAEWKIVDAAGQPLGRLSSQIAMILMGKNKPTYTRSSDVGDFVIVVNAEKVVLTGKKLDDKVYQYHTGYPGGIKTQTAREVLEKHPDRIIKSAVFGMLPKGHMGRKWYKKLRVFKGTEHPHIAQQPTALTLASTAVKRSI